FSDGLIQDRGYLDIRMDFEDNTMGEVRIRAEDPVDIIPDPTAKDYDPSTWNEVIKTRWLSLEQITLYYGERAAKEIKSTLASGEQSFGQDSVPASRASARTRCATTSRPSAMSTSTR
ncbi:MAG: portal protein, partial [Planctomycetota bacterium]